MAQTIGVKTPSCENNPTLFLLFFGVFSVGKFNGSSPSFMIFLCVSHVRDEGHLPPDLFQHPPLSFSIC